MRKVAPGKDYIQISAFTILLVLTASIPAHADSGPHEACQRFWAKLSAVPHEKLTRADGALKSLWNLERINGCELQLITNDALLPGPKVPQFEALEGTDMHREGWRMNNSFVADGPGTGIFAIEKDQTFCLVRHDQPAHLDDAGEIVQSETLTLTVQCRQRPAP